MPSNPYAQENYVELLVELEYAKRMLAQARIGVSVTVVAAQRSIEAIDHVEAAWGLFGRRRFPASRHALRHLLERTAVDAEQCIEAVKELSALLVEHEPEDTRHGSVSRRHFAFEASGHAVHHGRMGA